MEKKENIELKIGSPEMAEWRQIIDAQLDTLRKCKINIIVAEKVLAVAQENFCDEETAFNKGK